MIKGYDPNERNSILAFAQALTGKTLRETCENIAQHTYSGKGNFGQVLEKYYFQYNPNSESEPDFPIARLELKSTPLKQLQTEVFRSKERLVLNIINYHDIIGQDFKTSSFWNKNANLLLVFYLHALGRDILDHPIQLVRLWQFPDTDMEIIQRDWELIRDKVRQGKAHELSEGDTFYLGACTKGAKGGNLRSQPYNDVLAKQRAFSLKQGYVNHIIASLAKESLGNYGKLIKTPEVAKQQSIEEIIISKFSRFYGKSVEQIMNLLDLELNMEAKSFYASLTKAILGIGTDKEIEEFEKAEITIRTVRLKENFLPSEDISFPTFKYEELLVQAWDDSEFKQTLERKFLFVFYQFEGKKLILRKAKLWNMPYQDILSAKKVWIRTKEIVAKGQIVREIKNGIRYTYFPNKAYNPVAHVRPHARNADDTFPLPVKDMLTGKEEYTKQCFWLNSKYVKDEIFGEQPIVL
jgi:DNA mismatch repair protein MutH